MRIVSTYDFRNKLSDYINEVYREETLLLISRFNKPLVVVKPYEGEDKDYMKYYGFMSDAGKETGEEFVNRVRRSKKEKKRVVKLRNRNV